MSSEDDAVSFIDRRRRPTLILDEEEISARQRRRLEADGPPCAFAGWLRPIAVRVVGHWRIRCERPAPSAELTRRRFDIDSFKREHIGHRAALRRCEDFARLFRQLGLRTRKIEQFQIGPVGEGDQPVGDSVAKVPAGAYLEAELHRHDRRDLIDVASPDQDMVQSADRICLGGGGDLRRDGSDQCRCHRGLEIIDFHPVPPCP